MSDTRNDKLLPGFDLDKKDLKTVFRKRRRCRLVGHIWELESFIPPQSYTIKCGRCFPHIHSRRQVETYNLFADPREGMNAPAE